MPVTVSGDTHIGCIKDKNEDSWLEAPLNDVTHLMLVADGVSGNKYGEIASQLVVDTFLNLIESGKFKAAADPSMRSLALAMAVQRAHNDIGKQGDANPQYKYMACTCIVAIADEDTVSAQNVGDSRLYLFSDGELHQKSKDQTVAAQLVETGRISADEAKTHPDRNVLSQAMGVEAINRPMEPEEIEFFWEPGDMLLLCSDGLTDLVSDQDITKVLSESSDKASKVEKLIQAAIDAGGKDNISVILVENN